MPGWSGGLLGLIPLSLGFCGDTKWAKSLESRADRTSGVLRLRLKLLREVSAANLGSDIPMEARLCQSQVALVPWCWVRDHSLTHLNIFNNI